MQSIEIDSPDFIKLLRININTLPEKSVLLSRWGLTIF